MSDISMNIAVSVNTAYIMPLKVMLYSLSQNTDRELHIYLLYSSLNVSERKSIKDFVEKRCHGWLDEIFIDGKLFAGFLNRGSNCTPQCKQEFTDFPVVGGYPVEIFYRLLLPYVLDPAVEKILYMDADMIICHNIDDFYDTDMGQHYLCVAPDGSKDETKRLKLDSGQIYFNSGLLVFNLSAIRKDISLKQVFEFLLQNHEMLRFPDQDALNCLMGHNVLLLNERIYNNQKHLSGEIIENDVRVIHYVMRIKPWKVYYFGDKYAASCFWRYARQCGFKRSVFSLAGNSIARLLAPVYRKLRYGQ